MSDELLERAAAVLRERYDGASARASATEERMLFASRARASRNKRLPFLAIPLVAALLASTAWGATAGAGLRALLSTALRTVIGERASAPPAPAKRHQPASLPRASAPDPSPPLPLDPPALATSAPPAAVELENPLLAARAQPIAPKAAPSNALEPAPLAPVASEAELTELYRAAHRAQFASSDPADTLQLWDRYLTAAPNGSLALEARYNRAITLLRLARTAEAVRALEPFARGDYGAYRQPEARALLESVRPAQ